MSQNDLKPVRSKEEAKERGKKGGIASGEARRQKKTLKETLKMLLDMPYEIDGMKLKGNVAVSTALLKQALSGNVKAYEVIRDTIGEKPINGISLESEDESLKEIKIAFVDKSSTSHCDDVDPKIIGDYTPAIDT